METEDDCSYYRYLSDEIKWGIVISRKYYGELYEDIQKRYHLSSKGTISKILKKYEETGSIDNLFKGPGNYEKASQELRATIEGILMTNPKSTETTIFRQLNKENIPVSRWLIQKIRKELGFKKSKIRLIPSLTNEHKEHRVEYCEKMINDKMSNIIFSDECIFALNNDCSTVWYRKGEEKMVKEKVNPDVKIMVWGAVCRRGKFDLYWHGGSVNQQTYLECLTDFFPKANARYGKRKWRFQQDWAGAHRPQKIEDIILENANTILDHPALSPDLNPVEKVWSWMKKKINFWGPTNREELEYCIESAWELLTNEKINRFINHIYNIMPRIIQCKGEILD